MRILSRPVFYDGRKPSPSHIELNVTPHVKGNRGIKTHSFMRGGAPPRSDKKLKTPNIDDL